jgi:hypothetical protein
MNTAHTIHYVHVETKVTAKPAVQNRILAAINTFVRYFTGRDDPAALRYCANKYAGTID